MERFAQVNPQLAAVGFNLLGIEIIPENGDHPHIHTEKSHVVRNISAHPSEAEAYPARIGISRNKLSVGNAADVYIDTADHNYIGR